MTKADRAALRAQFERGAEYRRALASLSDEDAGTALACYVFSSLPQRLDNVKALRSVEAEPGFAGWGRFTRKPALRSPRGRR